MHLMVFHQDPFIIPSETNATVKKIPYFAILKKMRRFMGSILGRDTISIQVLCYRAHKTTNQLANKLTRVHGGGNKSTEMWLLLLVPLLQNSSDFDANPWCTVIWILHPKTAPVQSNHICSSSTCPVNSFTSFTFNMEKIILFGRHGRIFCHRAKLKASLSFFPVTFFHNKTSCVSSV